MSAPPLDRDRPSEVLAGLMSAAAIAAGTVALAYRPLRLALFAILLALIAAGLGGRHSRLAAFAVGVATVCWVLGMAIAIMTDNPLY